jgi:lipopolysaccharide transport system permease protein
MDKVQTKKELPTVIEAPKGWQALNLQELWRYREMFFFFAWRDIKVRYRQTILGAAWVILQPVLAMAAFSIVFGRFAKLPSNGFPYPLFTFTALLPWQFFAYSLTSASNSLITNQNLVTKVYFPRLIIPIASVITGLVDFAFTFLALLAIMAIYGVAPTAAVWSLPLFLGLAVVTALGVGLWLSALNVRYRDVRSVVPFFIQFWLYATPVAYSSELIPAKWVWLYSLNPMTGVVEGFRWALLGKSALNLPFVLISAGVVLVIFISGLFYFKHVEANFADII